VAKLLPAFRVADAERWLSQPYCLRCGCKEMDAVTDRVIAALLPDEALECPGCRAIA